MAGRVKPPRNPCFFKVMLGNFAEELRIPPAFIKHFKGQVLTKSILKGPTGRLWHVKVKKVVNDLFLQEGWQCFVKDNLLQIGDFLVFTYIGNSKFVVKIFGKTGCEKVDALIDREKHKSYLGEEKERQNKGGNPIKATCIHQYNYFRWNRGQRILDPQSDENQSQAESCSFQSAYPHFGATVKVSNSWHLTIPREFWQENKLGRLLSVRLQNSSGKFWRVSIVRRSDGRVDLASGWRAFAKENNIKKGDLCIFEFIRGFRRGSVMNVHIYPAEGDETT